MITRRVLTEGWVIHGGDGAVQLRALHGHVRHDRHRRRRSPRQRHRRSRPACVQGRSGENGRAAGPPPFSGHLPVVGMEDDLQTAPPSGWSERVDGLCPGSHASASRGVPHPLRASIANVSLRSQMAPTCTAGVCPACVVAKALVREPRLSVHLLRLWPPDGKTFSERPSRPRSSDGAAQGVGRRHQVNPTRRDHQVELAEGARRTPCRAAMDGIRDVRSRPTDRHSSARPHFSLGCDQPGMTGAAEKVVPATNSSSSR